MKSRSDAQRKAMFWRLHSTIERPRRFLKRHPNVKVGLKRAAVAVAVTGALAFAARGQGKLARGAMGHLRDVRASRGVLSHIKRRRQSAGLQALRGHLKQRNVKILGRVKFLRGMMERRRNAAFITGSLGSLYTAVPFGEAIGERREARRARSIVPTQGFIRRGGVVTRVKS